MRALTIGFVLTTGNAAAGTERTVFNQANALAPRHRVSIISIFGTAEPSPFPRREDVELTHLIDLSSEGHRPRVPIAGLDPEAFPGLATEPSTLVQANWEPIFSGLSDIVAARFFAETRFDVLVVTTPALLALVAQTAPADQSIVVQEHRPSAERGPTLEPITRFGRRAQVIVSLTERSTRWLAAHLRGDVRTETIPNFLPDEFYPQTGGRTPMIIAAGRMVSQKRFDHLITAFAEVVDEFPDWRLRIYGDGKLEDQLRRQVRRLDIVSQVEFAGISHDMDADWSRGSIFALSSRHEGFPMVALEASACGLPLVMYDCPTGPAELLAHGGNGILVPNGDVEAFAAALRRLMSDPVERATMGCRARSVAALYAPAEVTQRWEQLYAEVAGPVEALTWA